MSTLSSQNLFTLQLPLAASQQLAELRYLQGQFSISSHSADLLAGMRVKSRLAAIQCMQPKAPTTPLFNYANALDFLRKHESKQSLTVEFIQALHRQLNSRGGKWRSVKLTIDRRDHPEQKILLPGSEQNLAMSVEHLIDELASALDSGIEPLVAISLFTYELMHCFPFLDGNRRLALLLTRYLLENHGHSVVAYVDLESEFNATEHNFFRSLNQPSPNAWLSYWWVLIKRVYQRFDRQVQHANIRPGRGSKTTLIERFVKLQQQPFRFADVCNAFPTISSDQIRLVLRALRDKQLIRAEGKGRGARWVKIE